MADKRKLSKAEQKQSMIDASNKGFGSKSIGGIFGSEPTDAELAEKFKVDDVNKDQADYARAMDMLRKNNPGQTQDPMGEYLKRRMSPPQQFQQNMSDQEAMDTSKQFEPSEEEKQKLELKRKLLNNYNNQ